MSPTEEQEYRSIVKVASKETLWEDLKTLYLPGPKRFLPANLLKIHIIQEEIMDRINPKGGTS